MYASTAVFDSVVPLALLVAAAASWAVGLRRAGYFTGVVAVCWPGTRLFDRQELVAAFGLLSGPLLVPAAAAALVASLGRPHRRVDTAVIVLGVTAAILGVLRSLVYETFRDPLCRGRCAHSPLLIRPNLGLAHTIVLAVSAVTVVLGALVGGRAVYLWRRRAGWERAQSLAVLACSLIIASIGFVALVRRPVIAWEFPPAPLDTLRAMLGVGLLASSALATGRRIAMRRRVRQIGHSLAHTGDSAQTQLAKALGDPLLTVGYPDGDGGFVDRQGRPLASPAPHRARAALTSRETPDLVAIVDLGDATDPRALERLIGTQVLTALHNEALELQLARSVAELVASRCRVVDASEAERAKLERDIHDGAQHGVLALASELRRCSKLAAVAGDAGSSQRLEAAKGVALSLLEDLRQLAHGMSPGVPLGTSLASALATLDDSLPEPIDLQVLDLGIIPDDVARAAHAVVRDCLHSLSSDGCVRVWRQGEALHVGIAGLTSFPESAVDRIEVVGGNIRHDDAWWKVALPCA